jgi:predicted O-methyltransferase YrrM
MKNVMCDSCELKQTPRCAAGWPNPLVDFVGWDQATKVLPHNDSAENHKGMQELLYPLSIVNRPESILEVGFGWAYSTRLYLCATDARLVTVDVNDWGLETGSPEPSEHGFNGGAMMRRFPPCLRSRWEFRRGRGDKLPCRDDESFDIVFLDSDHEYQNTLRELGECWRYVRPGGALAAHDYMGLCGVPQAVREFAIAVKAPVHTFWVPRDRIQAGMAVIRKES